MGEVRGLEVIGKVYEALMGVRASRGGGFLLLIDPDRSAEEDYLPVAEAAEECGVDAILAGTSFMLESNFTVAVKKIKNVTALPVLILPGSSAQLTAEADAVLFTSLLSGRNPSFLIEEQVKGAPLVKRFGLEAIPTGYLLVESGPLTSVQFASGTLPIPREKSDIACAHALAAQYLGMRLLYLEAGSGARQAVPVEMVRAVVAYVDIPVVVGGGLRTAQQCAERIEVGAAFIVVGTCMEREFSPEFLREMAAAAHSKEAISV